MKHIVLVVLCLIGIVENEEFRKNGRPYTTRKNFPNNKYYGNLDQQIGRERPRVKMSWDRYPTFGEINDYIDYLAEKYSDFVSVQLAGYSYEGRPIKIVKIISGYPHAKKIWIDGGIHGREWVTPISMLYILNQFIENRHLYGEAVEGVDFYVTPIMNPDGYQYSRNVEKFWRKNRRPTETCLGVDLNRNWMYQPEFFTENHVCDVMYPGPSPISEPETQAIHQFLIQNHANMKAFLTYHTFGEMIMYPYGYTSELPNDYADLQRLGQKIVDEVELHGGPRYKVVNTYQHSGFSAGGLDDYAKEVLGIKYTYTVELRDNGTAFFFLDNSLILPTCKDAVVIASTVAEEVYKM